MDVLQKGILCLLKSSVTGEKYSMPDNFKIEYVEQIIEKHSIEPLIYTGALVNDFTSNSDIMQKLFNKYIQFLYLSERQQYEINRIYDAFEKNGIDYMPVKGCNVKQLYPKPEMRVMGDADILIKNEQYPVIKKIMKSLNFEFYGETDHDYSWQSNSLHLELHYTLMVPYNVEYQKFFENGWNLAEHSIKHKFFMSYENEFIYLFLHYSKHYRGSGIGCRHIMDLWIYLLKHTDMDFEYIETIMKKLSVQRFYHNTMKLIDVWFNDKETDEITNFMTDFIFSSGSWGTKKNKALASGVKARQETGTTFMGKAKVLMVAAFPPLEIIKHRYNILKKYPILLPLIWVWRWVEALIYRKNNVREYSKKVKMVIQEDLSEYEKNLQKVGLDFKFNENELSNKEID